MRKEWREKNTFTRKKLKRKKKGKFTANKMVNL